MKTFMIAGASSGIGYKIAEILLNQNYHVINASRSACDLAGVENQTVDFSTSDFELAVPESLDGAVYCPGTINLKPFHRLTADDFMQDYQVNVVGAALFIQKLIASLKSAASPSVVLFSTVAATTGMGFHASIASAKSGVSGLGRALAAELAPKIRVNTIAPSLTDTPLASKLLASDNQRAGAEKRHPLQRFGQPEDLAHLAEFLLSSKSSWITGQTVSADGGLGNLRTV